MALALGGSRRHSNHRSNNPRPPHLNNASSSVGPGGLDKTKLSSAADPLLGASLDNNNKKATRIELRGSVTSRDPITGAGPPLVGRDWTVRCLNSECNCFIAYLLLGMVGFIAFWSILMLRIYLPEKYWEWSYIWS